MACPGIRIVTLEVDAAHMVMAGSGTRVFLRPTICGQKKRENEFENFVRPFTPRNQRRSPRNFAKMRFGRFPTFRFSTSKMFLSQNFARFSMFLLGFWGATPILTSPADSSQFFALDWPIKRSVRPKFIENAYVSDFVFPFFLATGGTRRFELIWNVSKCFETF